MPGKDGVVRVARVKTAGGKTYLRPVVKLIVLEAAAEQEKNFVRDVANGAGNEADRFRDRDQQAGDRGKHLFPNFALFFNPSTRRIDRFLPSPRVSEFQPPGN